MITYKMKAIISLEEVTGNVETTMYVQADSVVQAEALAEERVRIDYPTLKEMEVICV